MAIKLSLGKLRLSLPLAELVQEHAVEAGILLLGLTMEHVIGVVSLPHHHGDPFDRVLVAQAMHEDMCVVACDAAFDAYSVQRIW